MLTIVTTGVVVTFDMWLDTIDSTLIGLDVTKTLGLFTISPLWLLTTGTY